MYPQTKISVDCAVVSSLQKEDGSFSGDEWGEIDTRFSYCSICCLGLLGRTEAIRMDRAVDYIVRCKNFDGGFGSIPGAESHAGQGRFFLVNVDSFLLCGGSCHRERFATCRRRPVGMVVV